MRGFPGNQETMELRPCTLCKFLHLAAYTYNVLHMRDVGICTVYTQSNYTLSSPIPV